jgi:hypothetical protein
VFGAKKVRAFLESDMKYIPPSKEFVEYERRASTENSSSSSIVDSYHQLGPHVSDEKFKFDLTMRKIMALENKFARALAFLSRKVLFESDEYRCMGAHNSSKAINFSSRSKAKGGFSRTHFDGCFCSEYGDGLMGGSKLARNEEGEYSNESHSLKGLLYLHGMGCRELRVYCYCQRTSATTGSAPRLYGGDSVLNWPGEAMTITREHGSTTLMGVYTAGHFRLVVFNPPDEDYLERSLSAAHNCRSCG